MSRSVKFHDYVAPIRKTLTVSLKQSSSSYEPSSSSSHQRQHHHHRQANEEDNQSSKVKHDPFPHSNDIRIAHFHETTIVMHSKAKPKKIALETTQGQSLLYLCKQEKNGDLRKDARLMEFAIVVNRMLQHDVAGRRRKLALRTFAVICLSEECGLLEWVPNTSPLRSLISDAYNAYPANNLPRFTTVRDAFCGLQSERNSTQADMARKFTKNFFPQFTPCFHKWFLSQFTEPTAWFEARTAYTRSVAVWSAVGHVVGLGDRHCENILIDVSSGECVHVDFDCLFDKVQI
jgi:serine/threonine-protein kinase ATR